VRPLVGISSYARGGQRLSFSVPCEYVDAVRKAGGVPVVLPPVLGPVHEALDAIDGLILPGGGDIHPEHYGGDEHDANYGICHERDHFELVLARAALERPSLPIMCVCRGMQILNVATGGTLEHHLPDRLGHDRHRVTPGSWSEHEVQLEPGSLAAEAAGGEVLTVKSHHHQGVSELGKAWTATGWSDEDETVEAIEAPDRSFALGVLWHPEEEPEGRVIPALVEISSG
jgi:gamma-glutamyl-gamma-aminobutyrate hydrolase PuuD